MIEINNKTDFDIDSSLVESVVEKFLEEHEKSGYSVSIAIVGSDEIKKINKECRGIDSVTDILSFENDRDEQDVWEEGKGEYFGELIICYSRIIEQAKKYSDNTKQEFIFILVHGLLHLAGFEDQSDEGIAEMENQGKKFVQKLKETTI